MKIKKHIQIRKFFLFLRNGQQYNDTNNMIKQQLYMVFILGPFQVAGYLHIKNIQVFLKL